MARAMKDSGVAWIGEIPEEWSVLPAQRGFSEVKRKNSDGAVQKALQFKFGVIIPKTNFDADDDYVADTILTYTVVEPGTVMINGLNLNYDFKTQRTGLVKEKGVITSAYLALWPNPRLIIPEFATYLFKGYETRLALHNMGAGIRLTLGYKEFKKQPVLFPSLPEQFRIAEFLDRRCAEIDSVIASTQRTIEEYKKLKQSIITEAVTHGVRGPRKMKDSGVEWIGDMPESWEIMSLGAITLSMRNGYVGPTKDLFVENGVPYIQSLHIKDGIIDFDRHEYYVSDEWAVTHPKIKENDILIVQTGDIGSVGLVTTKYNNCNCHALIIATPNQMIVLPKFLTYYLRSTVGRELVLLYKTGALLPHLNSGKIKFAKVCVPQDLSEQGEIVDCLDEKCAEIDCLIEAKQQLLDQLEAYKKSVIYEYVTGKKET